MPGLPCIAAAGGPGWAFGEALPGGASAARAMRDRGPDSLTGLGLYVGLPWHPGMLQRAKYSRFRNESVTSLEEGGPPGSVGTKGAPQPPPPDLSPAPQDATPATQESPTPLCTLIPRLASVKLANPATLLSLKNFCLGTKEVPRLKLQETQDSAPSSPAPSDPSAHRTRALHDRIAPLPPLPPPPPPPELGGGRAACRTPDACPLPGPGEPTPGSRPDRIFMQHLLGMGMNFCVRVSSLLSPAPSENSGGKETPPRCEGLPLT